MSDSQEHAGFLAPDPADLAPLFPGYEIEGLIATGGMGAVYCAVQKSLDRTVALKILPMEFSKDAAFCAGFEAEAKAMARLNHPNLIGVFDFGEVNGMLYIIMEYVPGQSIYHSADGIAIDPAEVIRLVTGICNGLAHAHENGIIHRDIKPSNILLDLNAQPKIGDFGLARPIEWKVEEGDEIFGTPHYTAPEVVNSPHSVDYRADIFSVGVLLHELLTGKLPADDPRPASTIIRCDPRFDAIIRRATQPLPAARYSSAKEMANDLQAITTPSAPHIPRVAALAAPRHMKPVRVYSAPGKKKSSGAPLVVFLLAAVAAFAAFAYHSKNPPAKTVVPTVVIRPPAPTNPTQKTEPVASPDNEPEPDSVPKPPAEPAVEAETAPEVVPAAAASAEPKYDVTGLLGRGRKNLQDRAKPLISSCQVSLKSNLADFERAVKRQLRKMKLDGNRVELAVDKTFAGWKDDDGRIPGNPRRKLAMIDDIDGISAPFLQKQTGIDDTLQQGLAPFSATYVLGLEKQIDRLKADNDTGAIDLIKREIKRTKEDPKYFSGLMLGTASPDE